MMIEDVSLDNLQAKLDVSAVPVILRLLPIFFIALSLFDALGLTAGKPAIVGLLFAGDRRSEIPFAQLLTVEIIVQAGLLVGAVVLRYKSPFAGMVRLQSRDQLFDINVLRALVGDFAQPDSPPELAASRRKRLGLLVVILATIGAVVVAPPAGRLWLIPLIAAGWIAVSAAIAWLAVFATSARSGVGTMSVVAASALSLLLLLTLRGFDASPQAIVMALIFATATAACFVFVITVDPTRERTLRIQTTAGATRGFYPLEGDSRDGGPVFLRFQLDESSPVLAFAADHDGKTFRPIAIDDGPIALHGRKVWIWNLRRLRQLVPNEIELHDRGGYVVATARVTQLQRIARIQGADGISQDNLRNAAEKILVDSFADVLEIELINVFREFAARFTPDLANVQSRLTAERIALASMSKISNQADPDEFAKRFAESWATCSFEIETVLGKIKAGCSDEVQLNDAWIERIGQELIKEQVGETKLTASEAQQIVSLLGMKVSIIRSDLGSAADALNQQLVDMPKAIEGRFDEERVREHETLQTLLKDPVTAMQYVRSLERATAPTPIETSPKQGLLESDEASGAPRNKN